MSMFGANFGNPALNAAYDMMVLEEIQKQEKERKLKKMYGRPYKTNEEDVKEEMVDEQYDC